MRKFQGQRAVGSRLAYIKKNFKAAQDPTIWSQFLYTISFYLAHSPNSIVDESDLVALGATPHDGMLVWLFRENKKHAALLTRNASMIRDWYVSPHPAGFNLMKLDAPTVATMAQHWEHNQKVVALAEKQRTEVYQTWNRRVMVFKNGFVWRATGGPKRKNSVNLRHIKAVGKQLGHCYQQDYYANSYGTNYTLFTLFGPDHVPHVTIAMSLNTRDGHWYVEEAKGKNNRLITDAMSKYANATVALLTRMLSNDPSTWAEARHAAPPTYVPELAAVYSAWPKKIKAGPYTWLAAPEAVDLEYVPQFRQIWKNYQSYTELTFADYVLLDERGQPRILLLSDAHKYDSVDSDVVFSANRFAPALVQIMTKLYGPPNKDWGLGLLALSDATANEYLAVIFEMLLNTDLSSVSDDIEGRTADLYNIVVDYENGALFLFDIERLPELFKGHHASGTFKCEIDATGLIKIDVTVKDMYAGEDHAQDNFWQYLDTDIKAKWKILESEDYELYDIVDEAHTILHAENAYPESIGTYKDADHPDVRLELTYQIDFRRDTVESIKEAVKEELEAVDNLWDYWNGENGYASDFYIACNKAIEDAYDKLIAEKPELALEPKRKGRRNIDAVKAVFEGPSPLASDYSRVNAQRLALIDSTAPRIEATYYTPVSRGRGRKKLPGGSPGMVAFLDYVVGQSEGKPVPIIMYMHVRHDQKGKRLGSRLVEAFYAHFANAAWIDWGNIMHPAANKLYLKYKDLGERGLVPKTRGKGF